MNLCAVHLLASVWWRLLPTVCVNKEHDYTILVLLMNLFLEPSPGNGDIRGPGWATAIHNATFQNAHMDVYLKLCAVHLLARVW